MQLLQLRPGEAGRLVWLGAIGVAYAAATSLGDDIAQSVFVTRVGAESLPRMFLFKGALDVLAAALYLPLTRRRSTPRVWRVAIAIYVFTLIAARVAVDGGGVVSAYALYIGHECAWTILTIHWGVFILDAFDASQARRLFPVLFTAARLGGMAAGATLDALARPVGAVNLLLFAAGFAVIAGVLSLFGRRAGAGESLTAIRAMTEPPDRSRVDDEPVDAPDAPAARPAAWLWTGWARALSSPLVRAIAMSTAAMVLVRYGLSMVSIDQVSTAFDHDEDRVAGFLGRFGVVANAAGALLGVLVVPRLLQRFGVGFANLAYAMITVCAYGGLLMVPGLWSAVLARFINVQFKDALKTPLSTLFYGAEPPHGRALARALVFGAIIPAATVVTAAVFELAPSLSGVAWIGLGAALLFTIACALQNRRWRARMAELLAWKLGRTPAPDAAALDRARQALAPHRAGDTRADTIDRIDRIAEGLASPDARTRAVAEEVLAETIPRRRAHDIAGDVAERVASGRDGGAPG
jgi:hypothetical protein